MARGGKRNGSGRLPVPEGFKYEAHSVSMPPELWAVAKDHGNGNVSEGIRAILRKQQTEDMRWRDFYGKRV